MPGHSANLQEESILSLNRGVSVILASSKNFPRDSGGIERWRELCTWFPCYNAESTSASCRERGKKKMFLFGSIVELFSFRLDETSTRDRHWQFCNARNSKKNSICLSPSSSVIVKIRSIKNPNDDNFFSGVNTGEPLFIARGDTKDENSKRESPFNPRVA